MHLKNPVLPSIFDGVGMGLGFTVGLTSIGIVRELIGAGQIFGFQVMPDSYEPLTIFILAPGAFFVSGMSCGTSEQGKEEYGQKRQESPGFSGMRRRMRFLCQQGHLRRTSCVRHTGKGGRINAGIIINRSRFCFL